MRDSKKECRCDKGDNGVVGDGTDKLISPPRTRMNESERILRLMRYEDSVSVFLISLEMLCSIALSFRAVRKIIGLFIFATTVHRMAYMQRWYF